MTSGFTLLAYWAIGNAHQVIISSFHFAAFQIVLAVLALLSLWARNLFGVCIAGFMGLTISAFVMMFDTFKLAGLVLLSPRDTLETPLRTLTYIAARFILGYVVIRLHFWVAVHCTV